jgi:hypothetical protein
MHKCSALYYACRGRKQKKKLLVMGFAIPASNQPTLADQGRIGR